jgi:hypothetical protein
MKVNKEIHNEADLTTWAGYETEVLVAMLANQITRERGWDRSVVCRVLNLVLLSGGRSGKLRDPEDLNITVDKLRRVMTELAPLPDQLRSFTPSPIQIKILGGK